MYLTSKRTSSCFRRRHRAMSAIASPATHSNRLLAIAIREGYVRPCESVSKLKAAPHTYATINKSDVVPRTIPSTCQTAPVQPNLHQLAVGGKYVHAAAAATYVVSFHYISRNFHATSSQSPRTERHKLRDAYDARVRFLH